jgi:hypothetical protein
LHSSYARTTSETKTVNIITKLAPTSCDRVWPGNEGTARNQQKRSICPAHMLVLHICPAIMLVLICIKAIYIYICMCIHIYIFVCLSNTVPTTTTTTTIAAVQAAWDVGNARGNVQSTKNSARLCAHGPVQGHQAVLAGSPLVRGRSSWDYGRTRRVQILIIY